MLYRLMWCVFAMYVAKIFFKYYGGDLSGFEALVGDAWHNVADAGEAMIIIVALKLSDRAPSRAYPYGMYNIQNLVALVIGFMLLKIGITLILAGIAGVAETLSPGSLIAERLYGRLGRTHTTANVSEHFWFLIIMMTASAMVSLYVSGLEIKLGKRHHSAAVVADGVETRSDAWVELGLLFGLLMTYLTENAFWEFLAMVIVGCLIVKTVIDIARPALQGLCGGALDEEVEQQIAQIAGEHSDVIRVHKVQTTKLGSTSARIEIRLIVAESVDVVTQRHITIAIVEKLVEYLRRDVGLIDAKFEVKYRPEHDPVREHDWIHPTRYA